MIDYSISARNAMFNGLITLLDAEDPNPSILLFYTATKPTAGEAITDQTLLGVAELHIPCGTVVDGQLVFSVPFEDDNIPNSGTVTWARLVDGGGVWVADLDVELLEDPDTSTAAIKLSSIAVHKGGILRITDGVLTLT